ncbi:MAG: enoyl-CoA hydratase [Proteobacteria bacterium]|nr:enoyl-CoA hydratase [Pseudomonadota bacterium]
MSDPVLLIDSKDHITTVTLNRPRAMNALSAELRRALRETFEKLQQDADCHAVVLTGAGDRAFCAGLDLKELGGEAPTDASTERAVGGGEGLVAAIEAFDRPVVGAINGVAITGGFELALACDMLVASTNARFADTHARVGILPGWGLSQKLSRLVGIHRAKELSLTGNFLSAEEAAAWGLVSRVVEPEDLLPVCRQLAEDTRSCDPETLRGYKRVINAGFAATFGEGLRLETEANRAHAKTLSADAIAARRKGIQERGRAQKD